MTSLYRKALKHIISTSIYSHLSQANVLCDAQHGFREKRSCESQLAITIDDFMTCLNNKGLIHAIFLDFKKVDKVSHKKLCDKLTTYGILGKTLEWIIDFLSNRTQKVFVGGKINDPVKLMLCLASFRVLFWDPYCLYVTLMTYQTPSKVKLEYTQMIR